MNSEYSFYDYKRRPTYYTKVAYHLLKDSISF